MNCRVDQDMDNSFPSYEMTEQQQQQQQPFQKRRKVDSTNSNLNSGSSHASTSSSSNSNLNMNNLAGGGGGGMNADIWRPYLHPSEFGDILPQVKVEPQLFSMDQTSQQQDNFISFMLKGEEQNNHFVRDSQKILANMSNGLQLTKL